MKKKTIILMMAAAAGVALMTGCTKYQRCRCVTYEETGHTRSGSSASATAIGEQECNVLEGEQCSRLNQTWDNGYVSCTAL